MRTAASWHVIVVVCLICAGCAGQRVERGQRDLRQTLLTLHEEQLMDNLVRLHLGLPIAHLDYKSLFAEMSDTAVGNASLDYTDADNLLEVFEGAASPAVDSVTNEGVRTTVGKTGASTTLVSRLNLTAEPVSGKNVVYGAYINYLDLQTKVVDGATFRPIEGPSCNPPPEGLYILRHRHGNSWWYVPRHFRAEFRDLSLVVNNLNRESPTKKQVLLVRIQRLQRLTPENSDEPAYLARLSVPLPPDRGHFLVALPSAGNKKVRMAVLPATQREILGHAAGKLNKDSMIFGIRVGSRPEKLTDEASSEVIIQFAMEDFPPETPLASIEEDLRNLPKGIELALDKHQLPEPEPTEDLLRSLNDKLEQILLRGR